MKINIFCISVNDKNNQMLRINRLSIKTKRHICLLLCIVFWLYQYYHDIYKIKYSDTAPASSTEMRLKDRYAIAYEDAIKFEKLAKTEIETKPRNKSNVGVKTKFITKIAKSEIDKHNIKEGFDNRRQILCEALPLGCHDVENNSKTSIVIHSSFPMNKTWCLKACSDKEGRFAGIVNGTTCFCSKEGVNAIVDMLTESKLCDVPCPGNLLENCGGSHEAQVYQLKSTCLDSEKLPDAFEESRFRECAAKSTTKTERFLHSPKECILYCNIKNKMYALFNKENFECICEDNQQILNFKAGFEICNELYFAVFKTFVDKSRCKPLTFLPSNSTVKKILLASAPGSGNTWVRHLIEQASGVYTGSMYTDIDLYRGGFIGEINSPFHEGTFIVKGHLERNNVSTYFAGVVMIIRNPYKSSISEHNRLISSGHIKIANQSDFFSIEFQRFLVSQYSFSRVPNKVMNSKKPFHLLIYEKLVENPIAEIRKVMRFLYDVSGFKQDDLDERLHCLSENIEGSFKRKQRILPKDPFPKPIKEIFNRQIATIRSRLSKINKNFVVPRYEMEFK